MNIDDLIYSLRTASTDESRALLDKLAEADAALKAVPSGRAHATQYGRVEAARDRLRREAAKIVQARGWARTMPTDDYDGSYIGHEER